MKRIKPLDFVKTPNGATAIVVEVDTSGDASIEFLGGGNPTGEKNAWWHYDEGLEVMDNLPALLSRKMAHPFGDGRKAVDKIFPIK